MADMRMPGTLLTIWFVRPWPMKPAPIMPTRMGLPASARACSARSTIIMEDSSQRHAALKLRFDLGVRTPVGVLVGHNGDWKGPVKAKTRIVVRQATLNPRGIELADLVACFSAVRQRLIAMRKALGYVDCAPI